MKDKREKMLIMLVVFAVSLTVNMANADIVTYWSLDDSNGNLARDSLGRSDGILKGNPEWAKGQFSAALKFDGDGDYVDCGGGSSLSNPNTWADITDTITVAAWINITTVPTSWSAIVTKGNSAWRLSTYENQKKLHFAVTGQPNWYSADGNTEVSADEWHHVCGKYDGQKIALYVDGKLDGTKNYTEGITTNGHNVYIGGNEEEAERYFHGLIDDVVIFDHALSKDEIIQLYSQGAASFISKELVALVDDIRRAKAIMKERPPQQAVAFLEKKTAEYEQRKGQFPNDIESHHRQLISSLYFLLAEAKKGSGARSKDVITEYKKSVTASLGGPTYVPALLFLFKNVSADDYVDIIRKSVRAGSYVPNDICCVARDFELSKNWTAFELFLDGTLTEVNRPILCAKAIDNGLNKSGIWAKMFLEYCRSKPELAKYVFSEHVKQAQEYIAKNEFSKAAKIYHDLVSQCTSEQDTPVYELTICECLFNCGQYTKALSELSNFIEKYKVTNKVLIKSAIILKGRIYIELREIDQASDTFRKLMVDYPETKQTPEPNFYIGYCNMLQDKLEEAKETLSILVKDYPESPYASKARLCLRKVERIRR